MKRCPDYTRLAVFIFLLVFLVQNVTGAEEDLFDRSKLSGDWSGKRTEFIDDGITINIDAIQTTQGVLHGGLEKDWKYGGSVDYEFNFESTLKTRF